MDLGGVAISLALVIGTGVWFNLPAPAFLLLWLHVAFVVPEEDFLRARFGAAYDEYVQRRPRWILGS